jgi:hypothetical protein
MICRGADAPPVERSHNTVANPSCYDYGKRMRFLLLIIALAGMITLSSPSAGHAQTPIVLPQWVQFLLALGHLIEDGRACGLIGPEEAVDLYVAASKNAASTYDITPERVARVLRVSRDHARDVPVTSQICEEAARGVPVLRETLAVSMPRQ